MPRTAENQSLATAPETVGVYVHLPWCVKKCPYCDFNSHVAPDALPEEAYVTALLKDLALDLDAVNQRPVTSIYFGGETPGLFSAAAIERIIDGIHSRLPFDNPEITLEANPGTAEARRFRDYRLAGVNRLSVGVQSFDDTTLVRIGRIHSGGEALAAIDYVHRADIDNFNIDLMFAQPGQSLEHVLADVRTALACAPSHLSCYQLTIEPNTFFHHQPPGLPDDDSAWTMQTALGRRLQSAGFRQYEVSGWARDGSESRHNSNYWQFGDYIGIGAGAHGKLTINGEIWRSARKKHPVRYIEAAGTPAALDHRRIVPREERAFEFMLNALRLNSGVALAHFESATGIERHYIESTLEQLQARGLIEAADGWITPTALGRRFLNDLTGAFL